jgi:hypothetical protein
MRNSMAAAGLAVLVVACGPAPGTVAKKGNTCIDVNGLTFAGTQSDTFTSGTCANNSLSNSVTFTQASGSCTVEFVSTLVPLVTFAGSLSGSDLTWSGAYSINGVVTQITDGTGTFSPDLKTLSGGFQVAVSGTGCTGAGSASYSFSAP